MSEENKVEGKSLVLRHLNGEGPIEVLTRVKDFNIQTINGPNGQTAELPAETLVAFNSIRFRELGTDSNEWEFTVLQASPGGPVKAFIYLSAKDIFLIRAVSKVV